MTHHTFPNVDTHPVISAIIGFFTVVTAKSVELMDSVAHLTSEKIEDTFILGFVGALGGLTLSLLVKLIKILWNKRHKVDV